MQPETYVIVGAGVAGASAGEALRKEGFGGRIVILGNEAIAPYQRPPLSKQVLRGELSEQKTLLHDQDFYTRNSIELRTGFAVTRIDAGQRCVESATGERVGYDKLLIATGAAPKHVQTPGTELDGVHYLRTLDDCERLRDAAKARPRVLVLGTGFIGCEVAASLRQVGCEVVLAGKQPPMAHVLGQEVGELYASHHRAKGIQIKTGVTVGEFLGSSRVEQAQLSDQSIIPCDLAIIGVGVTPNVSAVPAGMSIDDGIVTDEYCRTSIDGIYAAGDVAQAWRPRLNRRVRVEHFDNGRHQGAAAGRVMAGKSEPYDPLPFFWSDQFELHLQYHGHAVGWDTCVLRGSPAEYSFIAFYMRDGRIDAVCNVNRFKESRAAQHLIGHTGIAPEILGDSNADLAQAISATS